MLRMANRAYAGIWSRDFSEATLIGQWRALLETVPFSAERAGFTELVIRAVDTAETPIFGAGFWLRGIRRGSGGGIGERACA